MASLTKFHYTIYQSIINLRSQPKPPPSRSIRASSSKPSFLKTTCVTLTTSAALLSASLHLITKPAAASPPPPATTTTSDLEESSSSTLEKHLTNHPNDIEALKSLMKLKFKSRNLEQALQILTRLIEINPEEETEWRILKAQTQTYTGDLKSAIESFEEILIKDPFRVEAYHGLVMAYDDDSKLTELESRINEAIEKCKNQKVVRDLRLLIAQIKVIEGKPNEAIRVYQELVKDEPKDFRPYLCQGLVYTLLKKKDEAEKQFEESRKLVPENHPYKEYFDSNVLNTSKLFR